MVSRVNLRLLFGLVVLLAMAETAAAQYYPTSRTMNRPRLAARPQAELPPDGPAMPEDDTAAGLPEPPPDEGDETGPPAPADEESVDEGTGEPAAEDSETWTEDEVLDEAAGEEAEELAPGFIEDEILHPTGSCGEENCPHCRNWYSRVDFTLYSRSIVRLSDLVRESSTITNPLTGQSQTFTAGVLTTKAVGFVLAPGARFTVGRYLGRDANNRDHMLEASFHAFNNWFGHVRNTSDRALRQVTVVDPSTGTSQTYRYVGGAGFSLFPGNANPGFDGADEYRYDYSSSLSDLQFNRRVRRGLRRQRLVYMPGGWTQQITPGLTPSFLGGLRFIQINENAGLHSIGFVDNPQVSTGTDANGFPTNFVPYGVGGAFTGDYTIATHNRLFGAQAGLDLTQQFDRWNYGFQVRSGLYSNFCSQDTLILVNDPTTFRQTQFPTSNVAYGSKARSLAFVGEVGFQYSYNLNRYATFRVGYSMLWVQGIALAPEQFNFTGIDQMRVNHGGRTTFQGGNFGLEIVF